MIRKGYALNRDHVSIPGEILLETMDALNITPNQLASRSRTPIDYVEAVLRGETQITSEFAESLSKLVAMDSGFWLRLDDNYQWFKKTGREKPSDLKLDRDI